MVEWIGEYQAWIKRYQKTLWLSICYSPDQDYGNAVMDVRKELRIATMLEF